MKYASNEVCDIVNEHAKRHGFDEKCMMVQDKIIKTGNAEYIYNFARYIKGADKKA